VSEGSDTRTGITMRMGSRSERFSCRRLYGSIGSVPVSADRGDIRSWGGFDPITARIMPLRWEPRCGRSEMERWSCAGGMEGMEDKSSCAIGTDIPLSMVTFRVLAPVFGWVSKSSRSRSSAMSGPPAFRQDPIWIIGWQAGPVQEL
jgi:hypothetical protein